MAARPVGVPEEAEIPPIFDPGNDRRSYALTGRLQ
jgi:hypothetical protein